MYVNTTSFHLPLFEPYYNRKSRTFFKILYKGICKELMLRSLLRVCSIFWLLVSDILFSVYWLLSILFVRDNFRSDILYNEVPANICNTCKWRHWSALHINCEMIRSWEIVRSKENVMADDTRHFTDIKDIRPGIKNLNCLFIVLEVGKLPLSFHSLPVFSDDKFTVNYPAVSFRQRHQN